MLDKARWRRQSEKRAKPYATRVCEECGKPFKPSRSTQKRCVECILKHTYGKRRTRMLARIRNGTYGLRGDGLHSKRAMLDARICDRPDITINEIVRAATKKGVSYGRYVADMMEGNI